MCDKDSLHDMEEYQKKAGNDLTRRRFGALTAGAAIMATLPRAANALDVTESTVTIKTPDGMASAYLAHPSTGKHPAVLVWADAFGLRPAFRQMGKRLAESGYTVLVPNPYYRMATPLPEGLNLSNDADRAQGIKAMGTLSPQTHVIDARAFTTYLDTVAATDTAKKMGTTGYCMGGPMTMRTAAERPDRIGAAGSFHGGGLVTAAPDSPHLLIPKMKAQYLFAIAENDDKTQPEAKTVLKDSMAKAKLAAEIEVYQGSMHGWCPPDMPVYNQALAEKAWARLLATFKTALV